MGGGGHFRIIGGKVRGQKGKDAKLARRGKINNSTKGGKNESEGNRLIHVAASIKRRKPRRKLFSGGPSIRNQVSSMEEESPR